MTLGNQGHTRSRVDKKIVYVIGTYPDLSKTFIDREILESMRAGLDVALIAIRRSTTRTFGVAIERLMGEITYLIPASILRLSRAHLYFLFKYFLRYMETLIFLLTRDHPTIESRIKTLFHFGGGVLAADLLRKSGGADHIHAHFADRAAVVALVMSRLLDIPYSVTAHAFDIYRSPVFLKDKLEGAKFATTCTAFNKAHLERELGKPVELIYHGLDFTTIHAAGAASEKRSPPLILSVGRLQEKKGFAYLVEACALLKAQGFQFRCEIVGDGPGRPMLASLVDALNLHDNVGLCGALPNSEVMMKYSEATVFALASCVTEDGDRDGIPNVILEAMAFELPVVSTNVSGIPEVIHNGKTGILINPRSSEELSTAIAWILGNPKEAGKLGRNALEFVQSKFDIRRNIERLNQLFLD